MLSNREKELEVKLARSRQLNYALLGIIVLYIAARVFFVVWSDYRGAQEPINVLESRGGSDSQQPVTDQPDGMEPAPVRDVAYYIMEGLSAYNTGQLDLAIAHTRESLRLNPHHPVALNNLGFYLFQKGDREESIRLLEDSHRLDPSSEFCRNNLINSYKQMLVEDFLPEKKEAFQKRIDEIETAIAP